MFSFSDSFSNSYSEGFICERIMKRLAGPDGEPSQFGANYKGVQDLAKCIAVSFVHDLASPIISYQDAANQARLDVRRVGKSIRGAMKAANSIGDSDNPYFTGDIDELYYTMIIDLILCNNTHEKCLERKIARDCFKLFYYEPVIRNKNGMLAAIVVMNYTEDVMKGNFKSKSLAAYIKEKTPGVTHKRTCEWIEANSIVYDAEYRECRKSIFGEIDGDFGDSFTSAKDILNYQVEVCNSILSASRKREMGV